ncbi:MAG: hypothetical protein P4L63_01665 [Candidatus Pacebacteria bacterium]|nr:hypothetical protein [Candidatus Paceibacterota bacterium]
MSTTPTTAPTSSGATTTIKWVFLTLALLIAIFCIHNKIVERRTKMDAKTVAQAEAAAVAAEYRATHPRPVPEFPVSGQGVATQDKPLKAWLDPTRTYLRPSSQVCYESLDKTISTLCDTATNGEFSQEFAREWRKKPAGAYIVRPFKADQTVSFAWYQ